ncbi:hypothetical protein MVEN_01663500 [Mycena venus]|uniref:Uncharacterized protein n=1 Tax=Mycena venus TaxID=2733690 RepID=A0A8H6XR76_9AGAR|nr:hypothetical protein MVEN_01663500 [Mycena venus]
MEKLLTYRKTTLWLLAVYLPTLIVPWVLICVLDVRPLNAPSYYDQRGSIPPSGLITIYVVVGLVRVLNSISGVLVVPVVGTIIAQAAVVFTQRRRPKQELNLVQLFALADRGWGSIPTLWNARATGASSSFLWVAALMTMISTFQQPIQSALVSFEGILVMSCLDLPYIGRCSTDFSIIAAYDAEPGAISLLPHNLVVADVASSIVAMSDLELQPNLWVDNPYARVDEDIDAFVTLPNRGMFFWYAPDGSHPKDRYFVSALQNGTMTGVLRQHAIRMNSSASCEPIPRASFPASCSGARPVEAAFSNEFIDVRVCVPGEIGTSPWTLSRDRQDVSEEVYIDVGISNTLVEFVMRNFTTKCTAGSTRGYFELGNYFNGFAYGPLIEKWPEPEVIERDFNDYLTTLDGSRPTVEDPPPDEISMNLVSYGVADPFGTSSFNASAPLITAASALFGNNSFLNIVDPHNNLTSAQILTLMCEHGSIPFALPLEILASPDFTAWCFDTEIADNIQRPQDTDSAVAQLMGTWFFNRFNYTYHAEYILDMSMFFANRAVLNKAVMIAQPFAERPIYTSPGLQLIKPSKTLAGTIIVSVLIAMQLAGLGILVWYIYSVPTWTTSLDALAVARIGRGVPEGEIPPLGPVSEEDVKRMREVDALVGVKDASGVSTGDLEESGHARSGSESETDVALMRNKEAASSNIELTLGGRGLIKRGLV